MQKKLLLSSAAVGMQHAERLIQRIIIPEGTPMVVRSSSTKMGWSVPRVLSMERSEQLAEVCGKNPLIPPAQEGVDQVTADLLQRILLMEKDRQVGAEPDSDQIETTRQENLSAKRITAEANQLALPVPTIAEGAKSA